MSEDVRLITLSTIDEERFGVKTAKTAHLSSRDIPLVLGYCEDNQVELLIARCNTSDLQVVHEMEQRGFLLMDTLIYFSCMLSARNIPVEPVFHVRPFRSGEEHAVKSVAGKAFKGYINHYHADGRLDKRRCDEVYADWAYRSCLSRKMADEVLIADSGAEIIGFGTMRINRLKEGEGLLFGVAPSYQGKGVYRSIMASCLKWCVAKDLEKMIISTQITNLTSQKTWIHLGFEPVYSCYTFHKWFNR